MIKGKFIFGSRIALIAIFVWRLGFNTVMAAEQPEIVHGTPGSAAARAVVEFSELARKEKGPREKRRIPRPKIPGTKKKSKPVSAVDTAGKGDPLAPGPTPSSNFLGLSDDQANIPPDTHGAVGPNHVMTTLNSEVRIQNRNGGVISTVSLSNFWASVGNADPFDPKALYDPYKNRWIFTAAANGGATNSAVLIGVTQTSDPTGTWFLFKIAADASHAYWADYPSLGFNKDWVVASLNMFPVSGSGANQVNLYVLNKTNLYAGTATFTLLKDTSGLGFTMAPAITYDTNLSRIYLLEDFDNTNGQLRLSTITGTIGSEILNKGTAFPTNANTWGFGGNGDLMPQLGSVHTIDGGDSRIQNLVYRNGSLWATHAVFLPTLTQTRAALQWWEIATNGVVKQLGRRDDSSGKTNYGYPSIAVNKNSDFLIGYSRFASNQYASGNYSFRFAFDATNTLRDDTVFKAGESAYYKTFGNADNRWGDYSSTVVDPINDLTFWTIQEYAAASVGDPNIEGNSRWGTWWARVDAGPNVIFESTTLTSENCTPTNGLIDPGETVAVNVALKNVGGLNVTNLTATLQTNSGIASPSGAQNYGGLIAAGSSVTRSFSFAASGTCGGIITAVFSLQDGTNSLGTITNQFQLGVAQTAFSQNFDGVAAPALPAGWTTIAGNVSAWNTSTSFRDTLPNAAFSAAPGSISSNRITSPTFSIISTNPQLSFVHKYDFEPGYDGGVLEISIGGAAFSDFVTAGGLFTENGYSAILPTLYGNPLGGRSAWTGNSGGFVTTTAKLPAAAAGKTVQLRWYSGTDNSGSAAGWYLDTIAITDGFACCISPPAIVNVLRNGTNINFSFPTLSGQIYTVEYRDSLNAATWTTLQTLSGDGSTKVITNSLSASTARFYRVRAP